MTVIAAHTTFFYVPERVVFLNRMLDGFAAYEPVRVDVFIHTDKDDLTPDDFIPYRNGKVVILAHAFSMDDRYRLTWKCRDVLRAQREEYDAFLYMEGDMLIPHEAFLYWAAHHSVVNALGYNLGFLRIETHPETGEEYSTDLLSPFDRFVRLNGRMYAVNDKNPYCAFWIYDKDEFRRFTDSELYDPGRIMGYGVPESSGVGLHGLWTSWYKGSVIPLDEDHYLSKGCRIYHLPNNFVSDPGERFGSLSFTNLLPDNA